jgi:hypothetical protein
MGAAGPAAGAAHAGLHFGATHLYAPSASFGLFGICDPANPLVSGEWRYNMPHVEHFGVGKYGCPQIIRKFVYNTVCEFVVTHAHILSNIATSWRMRTEIYCVNESVRADFIITAKTIVSTKAMTM